MDDPPPNPNPDAPQLHIFPLDLPDAARADILALLERHPAAAEHFRSGAGFLAMVVIGVPDDDTTGGEPLVVVDPTRRIVTAGGRRVSLTPTEYRLVLHLVEADGRFVTREALQEAGGLSPAARERAVDRHVMNVRRQFDLVGAPHVIETVRGGGYRLATAAVVLGASSDE